MFAATMAMAISHVTEYAKFEIIPLASAQAMQWMTYTLLTAIAGRLFLNEDVKMIKCMSLTLCLLGSGFIVFGLVTTVESIQNQHEVPNYDCKDHAFNITGTNETFRINCTQIENRTSEDQHHIRTTTISGLLYGCALCIFTAFCDAIAFYCAVIVKDKVTDVLIVDFWYLVISMIFSFIMMLTVEYDKLKLPDQSNDILYLVGYCLTAAYAHLAWFALIKFVSFLAVTLFLNGQIPAAILFQYVLFKKLQPIKSGPYGLVGSIVITVGLLIPPVGKICEYKKYEKFEQSGKLESTPLKSEKPNTDK